MENLNLDFSSLIWIDWGILGLIALSAVIGLMRGLMREVFSLALWGLALWLGLHYSRDLAALFERQIPVPSARMAASFLALFIGTLLVGGLLGYVLGKLVAVTGLSGTDRLAGLVFGLARGALIIAVLVLLAGATPIPEDPWWKQSRLIPPFQSLALWLRGQLPAGIAAYVNYPQTTAKR